MTAGSSPILRLKLWGFQCGAFRIGETEFSLAQAGLSLGIAMETRASRHWLLPSQAPRARAWPLTILTQELARGCIQWGGAGTVGRGVGVEGLG